MEQNQPAPCLLRRKDCSDTETLSHHPIIITPLEDKVLGLWSCPCYRSKGSYDQDSILKSRDITLPTKFCLVKAMVFPVVMHGYESWTIKKVECGRIDAFELWCWRRLLRVPWTARRSNQSILKQISPECSLEGLMLKPKLQYFDHWCEELTHLKRPWC